MFPARPDDGTTVVGLLAASNVVVAVVAAGSKITVASGTDRVKYALVIVCPVKWIVTGVEPRPLGLSTLVNQI